MLRKHLHSARLSGSTPTLFLQNRVERKRRMTVRAQTTCALSALHHDTRASARLDDHPGRLVEGSCGPDCLWGIIQWLARLEREIVDERVCVAQKTGLRPGSGDGGAWERVANDKWAAPVPTIRSQRPGPCKTTPAEPGTQTPQHVRLPVAEALQRLDATLFSPFIRNKPNVHNWGANRSGAPWRTSR